MAEPELYDVRVDKPSGELRLQASGFPEPVARYMLWAAIRANTAEADTYRETWSVRVEARPTPHWTSGQ